MFRIWRRAEQTGHIGCALVLEDSTAKFGRIGQSGSFPGTGSGEERGVLIG